MDHQILPPIPDLIKRLRDMKHECNILRSFLEKENYEITQEMREKKEGEKREHFQSESTEKELRDSICESKLALDQLLFEVGKNLELRNRYKRDSGISLGRGSTYSDNGLSIERLSVCSDGGFSVGRHSADYSLPIQEEGVSQTCDDLKKPTRNRRQSNEPVESVDVPPAENSTTSQSNNSRSKSSISSTVWYATGTTE